MRGFTVKGGTVMLNKEYNVKEGTAMLKKECNVEGAVILNKGL